MELQALLDAPDPDPSALLCLDLDRFGRVNDSLGRRYGDELLVQVAQVLQTTTRSRDRVARIGGDEFAVHLNGLDAPEDATAIAAELFERLRAPFQLGEHTVFAPASIGVVAELSPNDTADEVLRMAGTAMREAKEEPHQSFAVYEASMTRRVEEELVMDTELRQALKRREFVPFFQPIVALEEGRIHGFEVLARWQHPERGLLPPSVFLDFAEKTGLITPIGHQVIRKACSVVGSVREKVPTERPISLTANFSRQEFFESETHAFLRDLFQTHDIAPQNFTMEISERTVAGISEEDLAAFHALKDLGVPIILDDFGTGFSSLQSLRRLPVDGLKIDKDLLADTQGKPWDRDLLDLIVQMGHTLDQTVTAEGVETEAHLEALREMGCSYGQGFLFARPVPASELDALLEEPFQIASGTPEKQSL